MSTTEPFYTTVPANGTITLPPEFRGSEILVLRTELSSSKRESNKGRGLLSIAGILKETSNEPIRDDRYEYLMEKYASSKNTD